MLHFTNFVFKDDAAEQSGILIDVPDNGGLNDVATVLHEQHRNQLLAIQLILVRPSVWVPWSEERSQEVLGAVQQISERFPGVPARVLSSKDYKHLIAKHPDDSLQFQFEDDPQLFLDELRSQELNQMVEQSKALYSADHGSVFQHPSRVLSNSFLRVGNIQTSRGALDSLFFWFLPYLKGIEGILVDTWSISSIALNASRLLGMYEPENNTLVRVEMLDHYMDRRPETRHELKERVLRVSDSFRKPFLTIFSATMTGTSLEYLSSALSAMSCPIGLPKYLVIFRLGNSPTKINDAIVPALCDLSEEKKPKIEESTPSAGTKIQIDPTTYFPVFLQEEDISLPKEIAAKHKAFFDRYRDQRAIRIHEDSYVGGQRFRHHGIYLDVSQMLENEYFSSQFKQIIEELDPPPKMILVPPHTAGSKLAAIAADHIKAKTEKRPEVVEHLDLNMPAAVSNNDEEIYAMKQIHNHIRKAGQSSALLVLDDVMTTGHRTRNYQKRLRELKFKGRIHYLIGVCRMSSTKEEEKISSTLRHNESGINHTVDFVENVILPNWHDKSCPLCVERHLLDQLIMDKKREIGSMLLDRAHKLRNSVHQGLITDIFFGLPSADPLQITQNSVFVKEGATQAVVLCSVAAAIQELRIHTNLSERLDAGGFPVRRTYAIDDLNRYTDGILQASLLRCLEAPELQKITHEKERQLVSWARTTFDENGIDTQSTRPELLLAIGLHKIPIEVVDDDFQQSIARDGLSDLMPLIEAGRNRWF